MQRLIPLRKCSLTSSLSTISYQIKSSKYHSTSNYATKITYKGTSACQNYSTNRTISHPILKQQKTRLFSTNNKNIIETTDNDTTYATNLKEVPEEDKIIGGSDLITPTLSSNNKKKIVFDGQLPSGFDVLNVELPPGKTFPEPAQNQEDEDTVHYTSSVIAFEDIVYSWNVKTVEDVTRESLRMVTLYEPKVDLLFIGCSTPLSYRDIGKIQKYFKKFDIAVEQLNISNAMATFNMLNSEDRSVAVALVLDKE